MKEGGKRESEQSAAPAQQHSPDRKRVLARLKKPGRPLKTICLMKYVKAHKETLRPFKEGGLPQQAGQTRRVSKYGKRAKALSIRISQNIGD